jgi:asparagine synthase (glutamine-hydrolysing)
MCGFAGVIWKNKDVPKNIASLLNRIGESIKHRGPDDSGIKIGPSFAVVHNRLSIIDIAGGHQPMQNDAGTLGIAYNGEIYNYKEIRIDLEAKGFVFKTNSDTEVLLKLYEFMGAKAFDKLDGMFAVFLWDFRKKKSGEFIIARDHLGVKPLYLYEDAEKYVFGSELKVFKAYGGLDLEIDPDGVASYFTYRYCQAPLTFFKKIKKIEPGTYISIYKGLASSWRYWDLPVNQDSLDISFEEASSELKQMLQDSVAKQLVSDVPVGLLLSGGLDSSVIASICSELNVKLMSFNIGFPNLNEFEFSNNVARKFDIPHLTIETSLEATLDRFDDVIRAMDEPIADPACLPLHILCDDIKKHVKVVLSGEGSDEMFGGYPQYSTVLNGKPTSLHEKFNSFRECSWYFNNKHLPLTCSYRDYKLIEQRKYFSEHSMLNGMLAYDLKTWLPDNLMAKADKILMSHSLEGRFPFLSAKIIEFALSLPDDYKISNGIDKKILRNAFEPLLADSTLKRSKMGFSVPVSQLLMLCKDRIYDLLNSKNVKKISHIIDIELIKKDFDSYYSNENDQALWLWTCLVFISWVDIFFDSKINYD